MLYTAEFVFVLYLNIHLSKYPDIIDMNWHISDDSTIHLLQTLVRIMCELLILMQSLKHSTKWQKWRCKAVD